MNPARHPTWSLWLNPLVVACLLAGCSGSGESSSTDSDATGAAAETSIEESKGVADASTANGDQAALEYELDAKTLLAATLDESQLQEGWIRLFDGHSLFGWAMVGQANWRAEDGVLSVSEGDSSFLATNVKLSDYELRIDFRSDAETNSGVFLRTPPNPEDVETECLELNIAPPSNPFPTGSFVGRKRLEPEALGDFDPTEWHTYHVRLDGSEVTVSLDGERLLQYEDSGSTRPGHISLQHNSGRVEFRDILLRPINAESLAMDENWQDNWELSESDDGNLSATSTDSGLRIQGGLGQLQSKQAYGDFVLQATYQLSTPEVNSGIFFRCIRDAMLDGYECQVNHAVQDDNPLRPADAGAGAIFRRQPARIVVGDGTTPTYLTLMAIGPQISTWVNGLQVTDFVDERDLDENPRRGLRVEPGPISLQGHDPTTDLWFQSLAISPVE